MPLTELELPACSASETDMPEGWSIAPLRSVCHSRKGKKPEHLASSPTEHVLPYIDIHAFEESEARQYADEKSSAVVEAGVLLVVWDGARCGMVGRSPFKGALGSTLLALGAPGLDSDYLFWFLRGQFHRINSNPRGTGIPHVDPDVFWNTDLPIPPLAEQRRIVAKLEQVLAAANASRERLARVPVLMKRFRQSVLAAACSGRLTADWREQNPDVEPASQLLERILAERRAKWEADQNAKKRSKSPTLALEMEEAGLTQRPGRLNRYYQEPSTPDTNELPELPESWCWATIQQIAEIRSGLQKQPHRAPKTNGYPYLRVANVLRGRLSLDEVHNFELFSGELEIYRLLTNDLLIVEGNGSLSEIGRSAIWHGEIDDCVHQNHIIRVRVQTCLPEYVNLFWNSPIGSDQVASSAVTSAGLYSLSVGKIAILPVALPPLAGAGQARRCSLPGTWRGGHERPRGL